MGRLRSFQMHVAVYRTRRYYYEKRHYFLHPSYSSTLVQVQVILASQEPGKVRLARKVEGHSSRHVAITLLKGHVGRILGE